MLKKDELSNPNSCLNKAKDDEMVFVLLGRDKSFAFAVRMWAMNRCQLGLNKETDPQIVEALQAARKVEENHEKNQAVTPDKPCGNVHCGNCARQSCGVDSIAGEPNQEQTGSPSDVSQFKQQILSAWNH